MRLNLPSVLANILATATVAACGGSVAEVPSASENTAPTATGTSSTSPPPGKMDAGTSDSGVESGLDAGKDAEGCESPPVYNGEDFCSHIYQQPCGIPKGVVVEDGLSVEECKLVCGTKPGEKPFNYWGCEYNPGGVAGDTFKCYTCVEGRRPAGYVDPSSSDFTVGGWLAHAADLERVSVDAFQILRRELAHYDAPAALVHAAENAEQDEVRHTRILSTLARREGVVLSSAPVAHGEIRSLVEIAIENAVEGCIRETYGALVAGWQAEHAEHPELRRAMSAIYRDEVTHAELAWRVHAWALEHLSPEETTRVEREMARAAEGLMASANATSCDSATRTLGLPTGADAERLVAALRLHVWTPAATLAA